MSATAQVRAFLILWFSIAWIVAALIYRGEGVALSDGFGQTCLSGAPT